MYPLLFFASLLCLSQAQEYTVTTVDLDTLHLDSVAPEAGSASRIVGGSPTTIGQYPYTVQLAQNNRLFCGGSLITARHVLTAAHCLYDPNGNVISPRGLTIRAGTTNINSGGQTRQVSVLIVHERYSPTSLDSDVAVLLLAAAVRPGADVGFAVLPRQGATLNTNVSLIHVGWGSISENGPLSNVLLEVQVYKVEHSQCVMRYNWLAANTNLPYQVTTTMLCAGRLGVGGADACQGDSGGPLALQSNRSVVVGVTSWGYGCGQPQFPGVSARVSNFTSWIQATVIRYNSAPPLGLTSAALLLASLLASLTLCKDV